MIFANKRPLADSLCRRRGRTEGPEPLALLARNRGANRQDVRRINNLNKQGLITFEANRIINGRTLSF